MPRCRRCPPSCASTTTRSEPMGLFSAGPERPPLQAYGKLPLAKDYLRVAASEGSARRLRDWLDRGFGGAGPAGGPEGPQRFLIGGDEPLQGLLWPSHDAGGLRRFPFALFVARRARTLRGELERRAAACVAWWERLEQIHGGAGSFTDEAQLLAAWRALRVEAAEPAANVAAGGEPARLDAIGPGLEGAGLADALASASRAAARREPWRLPLAADQPLTEQSLAWLALLAARGLLDVRRSFAAFIPAEGAATPALLVRADFPDEATAAALRAPAAGSSSRVE